jgi:hypothetical protein
MHGALAEGALSGFELQLEPEWIDGGPADGQLAFCFARQGTAGEQTAIGVLISPEKVPTLRLKRDPSALAA